MSGAALTLDQFKRLIGVDDVEYIPKGRNMPDLTSERMAVSEALNKIPFSVRIKNARDVTKAQLDKLVETKKALAAKMVEVDLAIARTQGSYEGITQFMSYLEEEQDNEEVVVFGADQKPQAGLGEVPA